MGLGSAMAGGNPGKGREKDDFYPTPPEVSWALLNAVSFDGAIHECACGDGSMAREFKHAGYEVIGTDLVNRGYGTVQNFFDVETPLAPNIVTNPPFNLAPRFIKHALEDLKVEVLALVLKSTFWHAKNRKSLFDQHRPTHVHPLLWRPDFMGLGRPTMEVMWCVWHRRSNFPYTIYEPLQKPAQSRAFAAISLSVISDL